MRKLVLDKKDTLFDREGKELIPQEVELIIRDDDEKQKALKGQKIHIIPLTRGEVRKMFHRLTLATEDPDIDVDGEIIVKHCKNPAYTDEEVKHMKGYVAQAIVNTIFAYSGLDTNKSRRKAAQAAEDEFGKN